MTFPTDLPDLDTTRADEDTDKLSSPNHRTHHQIEDDNIEGIMGKVGVNQSIVPTSHDYKVSNYYGLSHNKREIVFIIDGGGAEISTGVAGDLRIPFDCWIRSAWLFADQVGSIVVDIWRDTYANFPPTNADTITGGNEPTILADDQDRDTHLAGWDKYIRAGDVLRFNVDSVTTIERVTVCLEVERID